jgi:hypothetical protein
MADASKTWLRRNKKLERVFAPSRIHRVRMPALTRSRIKSRSSWATAETMVKSLPERTAGVYVFLVGTKLNAQSAELLECEEQVFG